MLEIYFVHASQVSASPRRPRRTTQQSSNQEYSHRPLSINTGLDDHDKTSLGHMSSSSTLAFRLVHTYEYANVTFSRRDRTLSARRHI